MSPLFFLPLFLVPSVLPVLASAQSCTPLPHAPYTTHPYLITHFTSYSPSGRPGNVAPATTSFNFTDPNTCISGYCRASWSPHLGHPGPSDGFFPCNETNVPGGLEFDRGLYGFRVRYGFTGRAKGEEEEEGEEREFRMVGNGTLTLTVICGGSGVCNSGWNGVPSYLKDIWEDTEVVGERVEAEERQVLGAEKVEKVEVPVAESAGRRRMRRGLRWE